MKEQLKLQQIKEDDDILYVSRLARTIWSEHYQSLLQKSQIEYMLDYFQSYEAIKNQIEKDNYHYYQIKVDELVIGYTAFLKADNKMFVSKLYILKEERRKGYGTVTFSSLEKIARENQLSSMWLTVNRDNEESIQAYIKNGFQMIRTQVTDIKGGYVMDDYVMEKIIS